MITDKLTQSIAEAYKKMREELVGGQKKLDVNKNKKVDSQDLAILRAKNEELEEGHPANLEAIKKASEKSRSNRKAKEEMVRRVNAAANRKKDDEEWEKILNKEQFLPGDRVHLGTVIKGGGGHEGKLIKIDGTTAHVYVDNGNYRGPKTVKGPAKRLTRVGEEVEQIEEIDEEFVTEGYAVQGVRKNKPHLPGWVNVTRHINGNISSLDISRGKPSKVFDNEEEAKAHVSEIGSHLSKQRGHGWGPLTVQKVRGKATTNEEFENIQEGFSEQHLEKLRQEYGKITGMDPSSPLYKKFINYLDNLSLEQLKQLAGANIKFISGLAKNRVARKSMKEEVEGLDEGNDDVGEMIKDKLKIIVNRSKDMYDKIDNNTDLPEWVKSKITLAQDYISTACDYSCRDKQLGEMAVSQAQQRFMGMVHATQKGDMEAPSPEVAKVAGSMTKKAAKDYASTKLAGLPKHVGEEKEEQKPKLPPHLIKLLRDKGLLDSQLKANPIKHTIRDVTPKGYGPNEETELDEATDDEFHNKWWRKRDRERSAAKINTPNRSKEESDARTEKLKREQEKLQQRYGGVQKEETYYVIHKKSRTPGEVSSRAGENIAGVTIKDKYHDRKEASAHAKHIDKQSLFRNVHGSKLGHGVGKWVNGELQEEVNEVDEGNKYNKLLKNMHARKVGATSEGTEIDEMKDEDPCWKNYQMVGMKTKNGKKVPNCVPVKNEELSRDASIVKEIYNKAKAEASAKDARRGGPQSSKKKENFDSEPEMDILPIASERSGKKKL